MRTCDGAAARSSVYKQGLLVCLGAAVLSSAAQQPRLCCAASGFAAAAAPHGSTGRTLALLCQRWTFGFIAGCLLSNSPSSYWSGWRGFNTVTTTSSLCADFDCTKQNRSVSYLTADVRMEKRRRRRVRLEFPCEFSTSDSQSVTLTMCFQ